MLTKRDAQQLIQAIIHEQYDLIGPLALKQASKVQGIMIENNGTALLSESIDDATKIVEELVRQYEILFGQSSVDVCKDAVRQLAISIQRKDLPELLR